MGGIDFPCRGSNPRLQAKGRVDEVALCDDIGLVASEVRFEGSPGLGSEVPEKGADRTGGGACPRFTEANRDRKRSADHLWEGRDRSCAYVYQLSRPPEYQPDRAMAERNKFAPPVSGVPASQETILGSASMGAGLFAVTSGNITDEMINDYINDQEGEPVQDDSRFQIDPS